MSDLISKNELLTRIRLNYNNHQNVSASAIKDMIDTTSTAYDIDKVVEELELHSFELGTDTLPVHYVRLNDAIEIVKQGGTRKEI